MNFKFEPLRLSAALMVLGAALIALLGFFVAAPVVAAAGAVWTGIVGVFNAVYVRNTVTPNASVNQKVEDTIIALAPLAPKN